MAWTTSANLPFYRPSPSQELPNSASRRNRTAASGLAAFWEEDYGSPLRRERPRKLLFPELALRASTNLAVGSCGWQLKRPRRSCQSNPFAKDLTVER